jgi:hypothetical protein
MFTAQQLRERLEEKPFRPFRIRMSDGQVYEIRNHDGAWVLKNFIEIGIDPDSEGFASNVRRCAILHITSIEDIPEKQAA